MVLVNIELNLKEDLTCRNSLDQQGGLVRLLTPCHKDRELLLASATLAADRVSVALSVCDPVGQSSRSDPNQMTNN